MNLEFMFENDMTSYFKTHNIGIINNEPVEKIRLDNCKGIYFNEEDDILINLNAIQYKDTTYDVLVENLSKTILHEHIHSLVYNNKTKDKITSEGEEKVCRLLADQLDLSYAIKEELDKLIK